MLLQLHPKALTPPESKAIKDILALDLDDDCDVDLVMAHSEGVGIFLNDGQALFNDSSVEKPLQGVHQLAAIDLNGDGALDLILSGSLKGGVSWLFQEK